MRHTLRDEVKRKLNEYNPEVTGYEYILECCDVLENMEGMFVEAANCNIENDMVSLKIGTYYAEISGNDHDLYSVIELASDVNIYSADRSNPDGAMFVISMDFKIGGV